MHADFGVPYRRDCFSRCRAESNRMAAYRYASEVRALCCGCNATGISSLLTVSRKSKYALENEVVGCCLINAGDSTQRFCNENKIKLSKISAIILTSFAPQNISGLSGILLSLSDLGVGSVTICGPTGLDALLDVIAPFTNRKYPQLFMQIMNKNDVTKVVLLEYFTIYLEPVVVLSNNTNMNTIAIYATIIPTVVSDIINNTRNFISNGITCLPYETTFAVSPSMTDSITAIHTIFKGLVAVMLLYPMSAQASINERYERVLSTIYDGNNTHQKSHYYSFIFFTSQLNNNFCEVLQTQKSLVFLKSISHSTGCISSAPFPRLLSVCEDREDTTKTLSLTRSGDIIIATPLLSIKLPSMFVAADISPADYGDGDGDSTTSNNNNNNNNNKRVKMNEISGFAPIIDWHLLAEELRLDLALNKSLDKQSLDNNGVETSCNSDRKTSNRDNIDSKRNLETDNRAAASVLKTLLQRNVRHTAVIPPTLCVPCSTPDEAPFADSPAKDVEITFLGTGSATPSKFRSNSCIMLQSPVHGDDDDDNDGDGRGGRSSLLLDVGEGSASQLFSCAGGSVEQFHRVLESVDVIWTSHHHADHICGFMMILYHAVIAKSGLGGRSGKKMLVFGPDVAVRYFEFVACICGLDDYVDFTLNKDTLSGSAAGMSLSQRLKHASNGFVQGLVSVPVFHCKDSYGVVVYLKGCLKIVYSGDCRPSSSLIDAGSSCDLLIHEATFDDQMRDDAQMKRHSTTSEAVGAALQMKAKHLILTHFSQRYVSVSHSSNTVSHNMPFVAAFDFLRVRFPSQITRLLQVSLMIEKKRQNIFDHKDV